MTDARTHRFGRAMRLALLLALLLELAAASLQLTPGAGAGVSRDHLPLLRVARLGLIRPLRDSKNDANAGFTPVVSARSVVLRNNITISQSRLVLSRLDQLFLLQRLIDLVDLAPKLTGIAAIGGAGHEAQAPPLEEEDAAARGFLFDLEALGPLDPEADVAIVDVAGVKLGFGWRYPFAHWAKLSEREKPKCGLGIIVGRYYYC